MKFFIFLIRQQGDNLRATRENVVEGITTHLVFQRGLSQQAAELKFTRKNFLVSELHKQIQFCAFLSGLDIKCNPNEVSLSPVDNCFQKNEYQITPLLLTWEKIIIKRI